MDYLRQLKLVEPLSRYRGIKIVGSSPTLRIIHPLANFVLRYQSYVGRRFKVIFSTLTRPGVVVKITVRSLLNPFVKIRPHICSLTGEKRDSLGDNLISIVFLLYTALSSYGPVEKGYHNENTKVGGPMSCRQKKRAQPRGLRINKNALSRVG